MQHNNNRITNRYYLELVEKHILSIQKTIELDYNESIILILDLIAKDLLIHSETTAKLKHFECENFSKVINTE